jgi:hypothetical protein
MYSGGKPGGAVVTEFRSGVSGLRGEAAEHADTGACGGSATGGGPPPRSSPDAQPVTQSPRAWDNPNSRSSSDRFGGTSVSLDHHLLYWPISWATGVQSLTSEVVRTTAAGATKSTLIRAATSVSALASCEASMTMESLLRRMLASASRIWSALRRVSGIRVLLCERRCTAPSLTGAPGPLTVRGPAGTDRRGACRKLERVSVSPARRATCFITVLVLIAGPESGSAPASVADVPPLSSRSFWSSQAVEQVDAEPGREVLGLFK